MEKPPPPSPIAATTTKPTTTTTPTTTAAATAVPVPDAVLRTVHASDQAMYPVALPYTRLRAWVDACPDLSVCFVRQEGSGGGAAVAAAVVDDEEEEEASLAEGSVAEGPVAEGPVVVGVVVVLPLRKRCWEELLSGRLKEPDVEPESAFPGTGLGGCGERAEEVGLHVYHVERFDAGDGGPGTKRFCEFAVREVMRRAQAKRGWNVVGMSALTATPAGKRAFEKLGFTPTGYRELFVAKASHQTLQGGKGGELLDMVCLYPGDDSQAVKLASVGDIVSVSEMTVNYNMSLDTHT